MASIPAQGMKSLSVYLELPNANSDKIIDTWNTLVRSSRNFPKENYGRRFNPDDAPATDCGFQDLPLQPTLRGRSGPYKVIIEVITGWNEEVDFNTIEDQMKRNAYTELLEPLKPKEETDHLYTMGVAFLGNGIIVKTYSFQKAIHIDVFEDE